jgi:hypothetical protein
MGLSRACVINQSALSAQTPAANCSRQPGFLGWASLLLAPHAVAPPPAHARPCPDGSCTC